MSDLHDALSDFERGADAMRDAIVERLRREAEYWTDVQFETAVIVMQMVEEMPLPEGPR